MPDSTIAVAFVGLISAAFGGFLQAFAARNFEKYKFEQQNKWDLYSKYFLTLGELSFSERGTERHVNALSLMAQLRGRIGIVGSPEVVLAVGNIFRFPDLSSEPAKAAMVSAIRAMRLDVGKRCKGVSDDAFVQLMFGSRDGAV